MSFLTRFFRKKNRKIEENNTRKFSNGHVSDMKKKSTTWDARAQKKRRKTSKNDVKMTLIINKLKGKIYVSKKNDSLLLLYCLDSIIFLSLVVWKDAEGSKLIREG